ncbi:carbohydrate ABC transporter permease [Devosia sp. A449]
MSRVRSGLSHGLANIFLAGAVAVSLIPLLLVAVNAFKSRREIMQNPLLLPATWDFGNFARAWKGAKFSIGLVNSLTLSSLTVLITLTAASLAAYVLARRKVKFWQLVTLYFLCATTVPIQLFLFPLYAIFAQLGLVGNVVGTAVILSALNLPLAIFLLRATILTIPVELEDAAYMDGAGPLRIFVEVIVPLARPGLITVAIIVWLNAWNEFLITSTFQQGQSNFTMTLGYLSMNNTQASDQGAMMAGAFILIAPVILFFILLQRFFIEGMTAGGVKG